MTAESHETHLRCSALEYFFPQTHSCAFLIPFIALLTRPVGVKATGRSFADVPATGTIEELDDIEEDVAEHGNDPRLTIPFAVAEDLAQGTTLS